MTSIVTQDRRIEDRNERYSMMAERDIAAAAPELLKALQMIRSHRAAWLSLNTQEADQVEAAIAKAYGEA